MLFTSAFKKPLFLTHWAKGEKYHCQAKILHLEKQDESKIAIYEEADLQDRVLECKLHPK